MSRWPISSVKDRDEALDALGRIARAHLTGDISSYEEAEARRRLRAHLASAQTAEGARRKAKRWAGALGAVAAIVAVIVLGRPFLTRPALTFDVDLAVVSQRDYLLVPSTAPSGHIAFSDGSKLTLSPGGRGRIVALHAEGAEIGLEDGRASLEVVHRPGARWSVAAGPFGILVTGTAFDVRWSGAEELFEVDLRSGSVTIRGPMAPSGIELAAGQKLIADLRANQLRIELLPPERRDEATSMVAETSPGESVAVSARSRWLSAAAVGSRDQEIALRARAARRAAGDEAKPSWSQRVAAGDFRSVLSEAEQRGLGATLGQSARPIAQEYLRRFPEGPHAAKARELMSLP